MLTLTLRSAPTLAVDAENLRPDRWRETDVATVAGALLRIGRTAVPLGDLFRVAGDPGAGAVRIVGDCSRFHRLAAGLSGGSVEVHGPVGPHAFAGMAGGAATVHGSAGAGLGLAMSGGDLTVHGDAGDDAGGAEPGNQAGMRGGTLLILGNAGDHAGAQLRRGWIAIAGRSGAYAGAALRAGTVAAFGGHGPHAGLGMVRGTLVLAGPGPEPGPNFAAACDYRPPFLPPLFADFRRRGLAAATPALAAARWRRWAGDQLELSKGEIHRPV